MNSLSSRGTVHFHRDLRRPSSIEQANALQETYLSDAPEILKKDYLASLQAAFTVEEIKEQLVSEGHKQLTVYEEEDRYLEVIGFFPPRRLG